MLLGSKNAINKMKRIIKFDKEKRLITIDPEKNSYYVGKYRMMLIIDDDRGKSASYIFEVLIFNANPPAKIVVKLPPIKPIEVEEQE